MAVRVFVKAGRFGRRRWVRTADTRLERSVLRKNQASRIHSDGGANNLAWAGAFSGWCRARQTPARLAATHPVAIAGGLSIRPSAFHWKSRRPFFLAREGEAAYCWSSTSCRCFSSFETALGWVKRSVSTRLRSASPKRSRSFASTVKANATWWPSLLAIR